MLKHIALALALTMGVCAFAQTPVQKAKPATTTTEASSDKFAGINSMVQLVKLRRQLNPAHRIQQYVLRYEPDKLCDYIKGFENDSRWYYRAKRRLNQEVNRLIGDTVFFTLLEETYYTCHQDLLNVAVENDLKYGLPFGGIDFRDLGWFMSSCSIRNMAAHGFKPW